MGGGQVRVRKVRVGPESCELKDLNINLRKGLRPELYNKFGFHHHPPPQTFFLAFNGSRETYQMDQGRVGMT